MKRCWINRAALAALVVIRLAVPSGPAAADPGVLSNDALTKLGPFTLAAPGFELPIASPGLPIVDRQDSSPEAALLRRLDARGMAAGFAEVLYDNRDHDHSPLPIGAFPRLAKLQYGDNLKNMHLDYGLAGQIILPAIVIGNSSTAITGGNRPRSQVRQAMTSGAGPSRAYLQYTANHLFVYPEHEDHDAADLFPASWPYMVMSQGSSYSDMPFVRALLMSVAALSPDTQALLRRKNLISPTLQMILRRSLKTVYSRDAYLSGAAHPTVFDQRHLAPERMVSLAASLKPGEVPPMVYLTVENEEFETSAGLGGLSEILFDTPSAIARSWRSEAYTRQMVVSASRTADPNGHPLTFNWVLLRGDPERVRIKPGQNGAQAEISVDWQEPRVVPQPRPINSHRVDIGVFAWNGFYDSAPAIISIDFPAHQIRVYEEDPLSPGKRLKSVDYDAAGRQAAYDPEIFWTAPWTDTLIYSQTGKVLEIRRKMADKTLSLPRKWMRPAESQALYDLTSVERDRILSAKPDAQ